MSDTPRDTNGDRLVATGIAGLDDILRGGFTPDRVYLIEGNPGSGKTTLALQYLFEGRRLGEPGLYVTLSETKVELHDVARSHGWSLDRIALLELVAPESELEPDNQYSMFQPPRSSWGRRPGPSSLRSSGRSRSGSSSTPSPRCGCSLRARSATAGKSSP